MTYTHLTQEERYQIAALLKQGCNLAAIADELGRSRSTISREISRNASNCGYRPAAAQTKAAKRQCARRNARQFSPQAWRLVENYLREKISPEQVSGRLLLENRLRISHECIYQHIYADKRRGGSLLRFLRCQKPRRKRYGSGQQRRGMIKDRVGIEQRPAAVDLRDCLGHWEGDTVVGKGHQGALVTLVERKSRYTLAQQLPSRHSAGVTEAVIDLLRPHGGFCQTLTFDNGKEFAQHDLIAQRLQAQVYFARPYHSWERGTNENTNGLLRQYFPKSTNLRRISQEQVQEAVYQLNHRPRKCLGYRTPHEVFMNAEVRPLH